jgi:hypothetical protein
MNKIVFSFFPALLFALSPFESPAQKSFEMSAYETKMSVENEKAAKNPKIKCRLVCDKKVYKEQKISEAIKFYKNSKEYKFK